MKYIEKRDGYVWLVEEHDVYGSHKSITNLGKDPDDTIWAEELKTIKQGKKKKSEE